MKRWSAPSPWTASLRLAAAAILSGSLWSCTGSEAEPTAGPGEPLPGPSQEQLARFELGKRWFDHRWTPAEGQGPLYMQEGCTSCHDIPTLGGAGSELLNELTHWDPVEGCQILEEEGGPLVQDRTTPALAELGIRGERRPPSATGFVALHPIPLYGLGLIEAIPDSAILSREDPDDADGDGISGRASRLPDGRLGRPGVKAYRATVYDLAEGAFRRSLGLTTPRTPYEETVGGTPLPPGTDPVPEPEISEEILGSVTDFIRYLAPAARVEPSSRAEADTLRWGEEVFHTLGCPSCHVPTMQTGPSDAPAFDRKTILLYSDMLLHDMGPALADICGPTATPSELRTGRLMGLRFHMQYMHDGRASTINYAILRHGGEATAARQAYDRLSWEVRQYLIRFLSSL